MREISCTLETWKATFPLHIWVIRSKCATEPHCHLSERKPQPFWAVRWATLPLLYTHLSSKANGTYHETFHSISGAANFLPDMKKMYSPQMQNWLSLPSKSPSSAFNHTQNQGRAQRKAADKNSFHLVSNFVCPKHSLSIIPLDLILFLWGMAVQVCLPLSSDEEREAPSVKTDMLAGLAKSQS